MPSFSAVTTCLTALQEVTLLHLAVCCDDIAAVEMLVSGGASVNEATSYVRLLKCML